MKTHNQKQKDWDKYYMDIAQISAEKSGDDSMGVGCVIVGPSHEIRSTGYNGLIRGVEYTPNKRERPEKYSWVEHAERNAIYNAARMGTSLNGCSAYIKCTDIKKGGPVPCNDCTRALIQSGIKKIFGIKSDLPEYDGESEWKKTIQISIDMILQSGAQLFLLDRETWERTEI